MIERDQVARILFRKQHVEDAMSVPGAAADQKRYRELVREHTALSRLEHQARLYFKLVDDLDVNRALAADAAGDADLRELAATEIAAVEAAVPDAEKALRAALLPPDPDAERNAMVEIRAGTGGDEAALFAGDLFRMYSRYAESRGWKITIMDASPGEVGGYKEIVFAVEGAGSYATLRFEGGGHRVQRVPETEAQGRIHTSAATVAVFPEADAQDDIEISPQDLRIDIYRASGAGGQHVNKTDSAVRMTHLPTGIVVACQEERSQHRNREKCMMALMSRLLDHRRVEQEAKMGSARRLMVGSGDRSERIRTYNFPQNRLTDHRINLTVYSLDRIIEGDLDGILTALAESDTELRLSAELGRVANG
jgi:peptide chain release factor 1